MDEDGYPTAEFLERITAFKPFDGDVFAFMASLRDEWAYADSGYWKEEDDPEEPYLLDQRKYAISTAGWSGNESIIQALQENPNYFWMLFWFSIQRGGHYVLKVYQPKKQ